MPLPAGPGRLADSKLELRYWRKRLFKCRYTYKGRQSEVRNWSVKIQHLGRRRTFSLRSSGRIQAAAEACELYRALVTRGWSEVIPQASQSAGPAQVRPGEPVPPAADKSDVGYWVQRLIHREYTMSLEPTASREFSVRINYGGTGHYFPLGTEDTQLAARRARQIYQTIADQGWEAANNRFARELTVALRWLDIPLAWTYTTIHTLTTASRSSPVEPPSRVPGVCEVAVAEPDAGTRHALEWCINHTDGFQCVAAYGSAAEALRESSRRRVHLALVSYNLTDTPGAICLAEMRAAVPETCGLLYSVYTDSEELFRTTPGGAGTYLLRRTPPTRFLEPIAERLKQAPLHGEEMAPAAWQYFKDSFSAMPVGGAIRQLANLTQREHDVLELLSKGQPDKDIADHLGISIHTVHEHVRNIFEKLGAHNRTEAAVKFLQK